MAKKTININTFAPTHPHAGQSEVLKALDKNRFILLRAGRKWRKTSMMVSWLFEKALETGLACPYIAPNKVQAKNIVWTDHINRMLNEFKKKGMDYKKFENELRIELPNKGSVQLYGVENADSLRGISNWGAVACFPKGVKVDCLSGKKDISKINKNDYVKTPVGYRRVLNSGESSRASKLIEIKLKSGEVVKCSPNHKIYTQRGTVRADEIRYNDFIWTKQSITKTQFLDYIKVQGDTAQELLEKQNGYTEKYLKTTLVRYPKNFQITSWLLQEQSTLQTTQKKELEKTRRNFTKEHANKFQNLLSGLKAKKAKKWRENTSIKSDTKQKNGTLQKQEKNGIQSTLKRLGRIGTILLKIVNNVVRSMRRRFLKGQSFAPNIAEISHIELDSKIPLYNLTVNIDHCYFANGFLVSNCDEYDDWIEDIWPLIIRPNLAPHKAPALIGGTPKGFRNMYKLESNDAFKSFHFPSHENPELSKEELKNMEKEYKQLGEDYYRQEIMAEYVKPFGVVYEEWPMENYKKVMYEPSLPLHLSMDFGVNDPTSIIWIQPHEGEFRVIDYYEASDGDVGHFVQVIRSKPYKAPDMVVGDPAGKARSITTNTSPIDEYRKHGIYIRTIDGVKIPHQIRLTHKHIKSLYVNDAKPGCERFRECILNYKYPEKSAKVRNQSNELPIHDEFCLHGKTKIRTLQGWKNIEDLEGKDFYVWGYDGNKLIPTKATECWKSAKNAELVEVGLDDGNSIKCTPNHRFMLRDGSYIMAKDLVKGDSLMPFYEYNQSRKSKHCYKHRYHNHRVRFVRKTSSADVYDIEVPETNNFVAEGVVVHNSHAMRALEYYFVNYENMKDNKINIKLLPQFFKKSKWSIGSKK